MRKVEILAQETYKSRRTMADAIEVLRQQARFSDNDRARIKIGRYRLPSDELVALAAVTFDDPQSDKTYYVWLPTSKYCRAKRVGAAVSERFDVARLDEAQLDGTALAQLKDGTALRAVEIIPVRLPLTHSDLTWRIIRDTLLLIEGGEKCYRSLREGMPPEFADKIPNLWAIDCGKLKGLSLPPLKVLASLLRERFPFDHLSSQQVANALRLFGMRVPRRRPRKAVRFS